MSDRQQRPRSREPQLPSPHLRRRLRKGKFEVARLLRVLRSVERITPLSMDDIVAALQACDRATAREQHRVAFVRLAPPPDQTPGVAEATAILTLVLETVRAVEHDWDNRLTAAGLDPSWPERY